MWPRLHLLVRIWIVAIAVIAFLTVIAGLIQEMALDAYSCAKTLRTIGQTFQLVNSVILLDRVPPERG